MAKRATLEPSEREIQKSVLDYLTLRGIFAWKATSAGIYDPSRKVFRTNPHTVGVADIIGILPMRPGFEFGTIGRFLAIECKTAKGKLSPAQEAFRDAVRLNGGLWILARSVDDVIKALEGK